MKWSGSVLKNNFVEKIVEFGKNVKI